MSGKVIKVISDSVGENHHEIRTRSFHKCVFLILSLVMVSPQRIQRSLLYEAFDIGILTRLGIRDNGTKRLWSYQ